MNNCDKPSLESLDNQIQELKNDIRVYSDYVKRYLETRKFSFIRFHLLRQLH